MTDKHAVSGSDSPKVAFIVLSWNNQPILGECFDSIAAQTYTNHITIMADNASADDSVAYTTERYEWVDVIQTGSNLGFAKGNNVAIDYAKNTYEGIEYFVLLNTDARLDPGWLETLVSFAEKKPNGAIFQSTTLDYYDHRVVDSTHIYISRNGSGTQADWRTIYVGDKGPRKIFGANAAAAMVSRRFMDTQPFSDLFDGTLFMYLEDVDISARATVMGWDNYLVPGAVAYHMGSASSGKRPGFSLYMTYRNNLAVLTKNIPLSLLIKMAPDMLRSDYHTIKHLRRIGQGDVVPKLIKGRIVGFFRLPLFVPQIWQMRSYRKSISHEYLWHLMRAGK